MNFMKSGVPLLLSLGILGLSLGLSWLLNWYGVTNHLAGNLPKAQFFYALAHKLTPVSAATHYNRGAMYEEQQNYESARAEYQLAIEGGLIDAYNNQARLYILAGKYDRAIALLKTGLPLAREDSVKYTMLKNQGWARLEQGSYAQAKIDLQQAIALKKDESSAYCLLAQVLEGEGDREGAFAAWESCLGYSYQPKFPEEDQWIDMASQRLDALMK
jgi:tetratricopeptide (TPR) repeat protein